MWAVERQAESLSRLWARTGTSAGRYWGYKPGTWSKLERSTQFFGGMRGVVAGQVWRPAPLGVVLPL